MKRNLKLTFTDETDWATTLEALRRLRKEFFEEQLSDAQLIAALCRKYLDDPQPQSGEGKP